MGPLFSGLALFAFGGWLVAAVFALSAKLWRDTPLAARAIFAFVEAATFLIGCAAGVAIQIPFWGSGTLLTGMQLFAYMAVIVATGFIAAVVAARVFWKAIRN